MQGTSGLLPATPEIVKSYAEGKRGWIICPKCLDACEGVVGAPCPTCGTKQVLTPLMGCVVHDGEVHDEESQAIMPELGYTPEEVALLEEFGV
jgi:hypothetical protein